jgi:hypothetical protein
VAQKPAAHDATAPAEGSMRKPQLRDVPGTARSTVIPEQNCPACAKPISTASHLTEAVSPKPGDFTICFNCGTVLRFRRELRIAPTTEDDMRRFMRRQPDAWRELVRLQRSILAFHEQREKKP